MKLFLNALVAGAVALAISATPSAYAQQSSPPAPAPHCQVGIGVGLVISGAHLTKHDLAHPDQIKISASKPLIVTDVFHGSPAQAATTVLPGNTITVTAPMLPGDRIVAVDGKSVRGRTEEEVIADIDNGPAGSYVIISIERDGSHVGRKLTIKRDTFCVPAPRAPSAE